MSQPNSKAEVVAESKGRGEESPARHKRVVVGRLGGPEVLEVREEELPEPGLGEVRVKVLATGVSYADLLMREGVHPEAPRPPFTPGWDLVGVVDEPGVGAYAYEPGQMVAALPGGALMPSSSACRRGNWSPFLRDSTRRKPSSWSSTTPRRTR